MGSSSLIRNVLPTIWKREADVENSPHRITDKARDKVSQALDTLDPAQLEHCAMLMPLERLDQYCARKAEQAKAEHGRAFSAMNLAVEIITANYPFFLALRTRLKNPGRRHKSEGKDLWTQWLDRHFAWCSRRTVYRAFRRIEQHIDILRQRSTGPERTNSSYMPTQKQMKPLIKAAPIGTKMAQIALSNESDPAKLKELAAAYLRIGASTDLADQFFPAAPATQDGSALFCPDNYNETFPFYPPLVIHPVLGVTGIWFCRPNQRFASLFRGSYPRSFLKRALSLFPSAHRILHVPSGTLEDVPQGQVTVDLVRDHLRRPMVVGDAHNLPLASGIFDLLLCDRPYKGEDADHYGTPVVSMPRFMREAWRVLKPGAFLGILDLVTFPVCPKSDWRLRAIIGVVPWSNQRFRTFSILQKPPASVRDETVVEDVEEQPTRSFSILQKIA
jgi:hypothetical protein